MTTNLHPEFRRLIEDINSNVKFRFDPDLLEAMVIQESGGNPRATRYEPAYYKKYIAKYTEIERFQTFGTVIKERIARSYGLFQVMYPTAIMPGVDFKCTPEALFIPENNILAALTYLKLCEEIAIGENHPGYSIEFVMLCKYNGGRGAMPPFEKQKDYAASVFKIRDEIRKEREDERDKV